MRRSKAPLAGLAAALLLLAACAGQGKPAGSTSITADAAVAGGTFTTGGGLYLAVELREIDGQIGVCGGWAKTTQSILSKLHNEDVLSAGRISFRDRVLVQNLTFMARHPENARLLGRQAACVIMDEPWQDGIASSDAIVRLPRQMFNMSADQDLEELTIFRQVTITPEQVL